ncbi:MAG: 50S ribosomal protein L19 [Candidatus Moranbacteria bacterium RIFOXYA12_FULL_44_15]|nr:MAG: 50S ribosomal protein L19 [Candidatus Moranbacteria bacterium RIFOXYA12_FULL_44_15]OGI34267.1 MAG: 50S ribosomal protein L19 [Candidatus Moranbacteria bacterium RIFOXYA2_FULL_43_15]
MRQEIIEFNKSQRVKAVPDLQAGDVVKIYMRIKEGEKERTQMFEGLIIAISARQSSSPKITVRKVSHGVGVELILPVYSPNIEKIELVKRAKVRRAKLYYVRSLTAKQSRMKYKDIKDYTQKDAEGIKNDTEAEKPAEEAKAEEDTVIAESEQ